MSTVALAAIPPEGLTAAEVREFSLDDLADDLMSVDFQIKSADEALTVLSRREAAAKADVAQQVARAAAFDARFRLTDITAVADPDPPLLLRRSDGASYLYLEVRNGCFGPSEDGKTWLMLYAAAQELREGRPVFMLDYENGPRIIKDRLRRLGLGDAQLRGLWFADMINETSAFPRLSAEKYGDRLLADGGRLALIEAITPIMSRRGLRPNEADDVETFFQEDVDAWAAAGAAAVTMDNTPKSDPHSQLGSQHKRAGNRGVSLNVVNKMRFSADQRGFSQVFVDKDRPGLTRWVSAQGRRHAGDFHVIPRGSGLLHLEFVPPGEPTSDGSVPTSLVHGPNKDRATEAVVIDFVSSQPAGVASTQSMILKALADHKKATGEDVHTHKNYVGPLVVGSSGLVAQGALDNLGVITKWQIVPAVTSTDEDGER